MTSKYDDEPFVIFTGMVWQAVMVKERLEESGVNAYLKDDINGYFNPWWESHGGTSIVKVMISGRSFSRAMNVIHQFEIDTKDD